MWHLNGSYNEVKVKMAKCLGIKDHRLPKNLLFEPSILAISGQTQIRMSLTEIGRAHMNEFEGNSVKLSSEEDLQFEAYSGIVTIILINIKILFGIQIYGKLLWKKYF